MEGIEFLELEKRKRRPKLSRWWWFTLIASIILIAFIGNFLGLTVAALALVADIVFLMRLGKMGEDFERLVQTLFVPGAVTAILVASLLHMLMNKGALTGLIETPPLSILAGGPTERTIWAIGFGLLAGVLVAYLILEAYLFFNVRSISSFTGLPPGEVRKILTGLFLGTNYPYIIIKDGEVTQTNPEGLLPRLGGPGLAIIHPNSAVIFARGDKLTRIELKGMVTTQRFEAPYKVIDLRPQSNNRVVEGVLTKDGMSLKIEVGIFYQIRRHGEPSKENPFPVNHKDVFKAATFVNNWKAATEFVGDYVLRDVVAGLTLEELYDFDPATGQPVPRDRIRSEVRRKLDSIARDWGVEVTWIDIGKIEMPQEARDLLMNKWLTKQKEELAQIERIIRVTQSEGEAEALQTIERARANAQAQMIAAIRKSLDKALSPEETSRIVGLLRFIEAMERIAKDPSTKLLFPYGLPFQDSDAIRQLLEAEQRTGQFPSSSPLAQLPSGQEAKNGA